MHARRRRMQRAYTLLELILALALTTVILGLVAMAIHVNLVVADRSRSTVEEAQLARTLLQRIAEDLRNTVPYSASSSSSTDSTSTSASSSSSTTSSSSSSSSTSDSTDSSDASDEVAVAGIYGSRQALQIDAWRQPRLDRTLLEANADYTLQPLLGGVRTVTYCLGQPNTLSPTEGQTSSGGQGLYRRELDRAQYVFASLTGVTDQWEQGTVLLAAEVVDLSFTYYNDEITSEEWDTATEGCLPTAVEIAISLRIQPTGTNAARAKAEEAPPVTYRMLVNIPNAALGSDAAATETTDSSSSE